MDVDKYISVLAEIKELHYADDEVIYCPHPQERSTGFDRIVSNRLGWKTRASDQPIELELIEANPQPRRIATFYSSVIMTVPKIFGNQLPLCVFVLDSERHLLPGVGRKSIVDLYDKLKDIQQLEHDFQMVGL